MIVAIEELPQQAQSRSNSIPVHPLDLFGRWCSGMPLDEFTQAFSRPIK